MGKSEVKKLLDEAEAYLSQGSYDEAVDRASSALFHASYCVQRDIVGVGVHRNAFLMSDYKGKNLKYDEGVREAFSRMQSTLLLLFFGIDWSAHVRYSEIAGRERPAYRDFEGQQFRNADDSKFVISYCKDTIARIEKKVGSLDTPFCPTFP